MDYEKWSEEYYSQARGITSVIEKYKSELKTSRGKNYERLNSVISGYRCIYYELLDTARTLEAKAKETAHAA